MIVMGEWRGEGGGGGDGGDDDGGGGGGGGGDADGGGGGGGEGSGGEGGSGVRRGWRWGLPAVARPPVRRGHQLRTACGEGSEVSYRALRPLYTLHG